MTLPEGEVVFCFTDVEGSTRLAHDLGSQFAQLSDEHRRVVRAAVDAHEGVEVSTHGDSFFVVFGDADAAVGAAHEVHQTLERLPLRVRIGLHAGAAELVDGTYLGTEVNRAARISDAAHGGQTLVSAAVRAQLTGRELVELGLHRLKGFVEPVALFQLGRGEFAPPRAVRQRSLPAPTDRFVGREADLEQLDVLLAGEERLITVVGTGGVGKTRLLLEAATRRESAWPGGVHWVALADVETPDLVPTEIARIVGVESLDQLASRLEDAAALLVLDNAEHLAPAIGATIEELLLLCPTLTIAATSREQLRVAGERLLPLGRLDRASAVELFLTRARQLNPGFAPDDEALAGLCERLDDLPLALELAAARTTLLNVQQLVHRLSASLDLLGPLQATVEWSYGLLSAEERAAYERVSIFAGGCTLESAEEVTGAGPDVWQSLVEKSMLEVDHRFSETRLTMLETIRAHATAALGEVDELSDRYIDHYLRGAEAREDPVRQGETQLEALQWFGEELANLRHAFDLAIGRGDGLRAARLAAACGWTLSLWDRREGYAWRLRALDLPFDDPALRVRLLAAAATLSRVVGGPDAFSKLAEETLRVAESTGDRRLIATGLELRAFALPYEEARPLMTDALAIMHDLGEEEEEVRLAINLGAIALTAFAWEDAAVESEHALALVRRTGNRDGIATTALNLAQAVLQLGDDERAHSLAGEVRELGEELGDRSLAPFCDYIDAVIAGRRGDREAARAAYEEGEAVVTEIGWTLEDAEAELRRQARAAAES